MPTVKLGDIAIESKETFNDDKAGVPIVGLEHLTPSEVTLSNWSVDVDNTFTKMFRKGDVLFGRRRAYLKKAAVAPFNGVCSGDITVIRAKDEKLFPDLLPFIIQNDDLFDYAVGKSAGSLSPRVKWSHLQNYKLNLPDMDKQIKIAELLWSINDSRFAYQSLLNKTDELVKSQFIEMFGNPVENDKCWSCRPLREVAPEYNPTIPNDEEYWWLNLDMIESYSGHIIDKVMVTFDKIGNSTSPFDNTMVLYSKLRPYLNKVVIPDGYGRATTELVGMKPDERILKKRFLFNILRSDAFMMYANSISAGGQMPRMPMKQLREFKCILPPLELQEQFISFDEQADKSKFALQDSLNDLNSLEWSVIRKELIKE